ncbi:MAG TPA: DUF4349 domain-containing protein, partial [Naasia sp.]
GESSGGGGVVAPDAPGVVGGDEGVDSDGDRDVIVTGWLDVTAADPLSAADSARSIVERAGGRLDSVTKEPGNSYQDPSAQLVTRIPAEDLDATLAELEALGTTLSLSTSSSDVTQQTTDLDARIASLQASVDRLRTLITSAATTTDLIAIETALSEREANLESLIAQRESIGDQVEFATVTVTFTTPAAAPNTAPTDFFGAVVAGWNALVAALGAVVIALGAALPWIVFLALLAGVVLLLIRVMRRRRPARPAPTSTPTAAPPAA